MSGDWTLRGMINPVISRFHSQLRLSESLSLDTLDYLDYLQ